MLQDVLSDALSQPWTAEQEAVLGNELGMESVIDAVGRVNSLAKVLPATLDYVGVHGCATFWSWLLLLLLLLWHKLCTTCINSEKHCTCSDA